MKKILAVLTEELEKAFCVCGYDEKLAKVTLSNRPDLCDYQCNGAMAAAKQYKKAPIQIAGEVAAQLQNCDKFQSVQAVNPGFINMKISEEFLASYVGDMGKDDRLGCEPCESSPKVVMDYGGANVAKPLHVGHLRSAIIGETLKRICRFCGDEVIADVHLGDWGLQMGLIIVQLQEDQPDLVYFDTDYKGEYPQDAPFTITELEEIYPRASAKSKQDGAFKERAQQATLQLQQGYPPYRALWKHILQVSIVDLKKNYENLQVEFDLWKGESDAQDYIPDMISDMKEKGFLHESQGAMVVDVARETDTKEIPPCIIQKSDGAVLYATSDLATLIQRKQDFAPDRILYMADKRQEMHFVQVFRAARKTGIVEENTQLLFKGFGTMNGKDGKPFKTRDGGVMRLETLIGEINQAVYEKMMENRSVSQEEAREVSRIVGLSALKYGDLSNQASKDYVFDIERFSSFEGNTGPYILYTIVRIKSILTKYYQQSSEQEEGVLLVPSHQSEKNLMLQLSKLNEVIETAYEELAPHRICAYIYELSDCFNGFYHDTKILGEEDQQKQKSYITLISITKKVLELCIELLGFQAPERM